jgi:haloalkane dehalogenase
MSFPDYPFQSHYAVIQGLRLHYLDEGPQDAEPVIMLHGNPSWSFFYRKLISAFRDHYRCVVPDHIGMGLSDKPGDDSYNFTLDQRVGDLETLLNQLEINNFTLVLHDWGGMIGMAYANKHPERIKRLVILNTSAFHLPEGKTVPWQLQLSRMPVLGAILIQGFNAFCRGAVIKCVTRKPMSKEVKHAYLAPYNSWHNRLAVRRFVEDIPLSINQASHVTVNSVEKGLNEFSSLPMMICWGMKDFVFDQYFLDEWIKRFPDAEVHRFEDAGHYVLEDAADEIIPLVKQFLARKPV